MKTINSFIAKALIWIINSTLIVAGATYCVYGAYLQISRLIEN